MRHGGETPVSVAIVENGCVRDIAFSRHLFSRKEYLSAGVDGFSGFRYSEGARRRRKRTRRLSIFNTTDPSQSPILPNFGKLLPWAA
ncbi:hypothetical protein [Sphingomonas sp. MMS24-J13]|uniref:hypothetical protein n=1 Tax=Sphingomonas sp. MMS24-J13 TaxID=3238686 RepID=UPI00384A9F56